MPKLRIEEAAARRQARSIAARKSLSGSTSTASRRGAIDILDIDNDAVRASQMAGLQQHARTRDQAACEAALAETDRLARKAEATCWKLAVEAARARATVGEIRWRWKKSSGATVPR